MELLIAVNPDPDSRLPYLMRLPLGGGMVFRTSGTWPRTKALYAAGQPATGEPDLEHAPAAPAPSTAEVRAWARAQGLPVPDRGRLRPEIWDAWRSAASPESP